MITTKGITHLVFPYVDTIAQKELVVHNILKFLNIIKFLKGGNINETRKQT